MSEENSNKVGAITRVNTEEDGWIDAQKIDAQMRRKWANSLASKISSISGVERATVSSLAPFTNNQEGSFEVILPVSGTQQTANGPCLKIEANPRSVSPRIRSVLRDYPQISTFSVDRIPESYSADDGLYKTDYYIVNYSFI